MARRARASEQTAPFWMQNVFAGQEMDRRIRERFFPGNTKPQDVITDDEYPFGHGGVFEIPIPRLRRGDGTS